MLDKEFNAVRELIFKTVNEDYLAKTGRKFTSLTAQQQAQFIQEFFDEAERDTSEVELEEPGSVRLKRPIDDDSNAELHNGDAMMLLAELPDNSIDMILTDLPYGTTNNKWDIIIPTIPLLKEMDRVIKPTGNILLTSNTHYTFELGYHSVQLDMFSNKFVWVKNQPGDGKNAKIHPLRQTEDILLLRKTNVPGAVHTYNAYEPRTLKVTRDQIMQLRSISKSARDGKPQRPVEQLKGSPRDVFIFDKAKVITNIIATSEDTEKNDTQKPVDMLMQLINMYSNEGDIILDVTMGSGSTGIATLATNRRFLGNDLNIDYFNLAQSRIAHFIAGMLGGVPLSDMIKEDHMHYYKRQHKKDSYFYKTLKETLVDKLSSKTE